MGGVGAEIGEDPPVLEVGEAVFDRGASGGQDAVRLLLPGGQLAVAGGLEAGDDDQVVGGVGLVHAEEAQVGERAEAGRLQVRRPPRLAHLRCSLGPFKRFDLGAIFRTLAGV